MEKRGLKEASDLMVSGCSAGGLATYLHADQWCDALLATNQGKHERVTDMDSWMGG